MNEPFARIPGARAGGAAISPAQRKWDPILPVPSDAPAPPAEHPTLGTATKAWRYVDAAGALLGYVFRFDTSSGKQFRPLVYAVPANGRGGGQWRWQFFPTPRPLYGLDRLAERPAAAVVVTEGEKAADAAATLLPAWVAITSPNGAEAAGKADWSPLRGRRVVIWRDHDEAGEKYAAAVVKAATIAGAQSVEIADPPKDAPEKWDAHDALAEGWDTARALELIEAARPIAGAPAASGDKKSKRRRIPQRDKLMALTELCEFWHDASRGAYVSLTAGGGHREHWPVRSQAFQDWWSCEYYKAHGAPMGGQALEDTLRIARARAIGEGPEYKPFVRVGEHAGAVYLDLGDARWRAIEITPQRWRVVDKPPVKFLRTQASRALPEPVHSTDVRAPIGELRAFVNAPDEDFAMIVAWLVGALRPRGPCPILVVNGEHGTGKSGMCRMLRSLVDPSAAMIRGAPRDDRDLMISAGNSWVLAFDNLSAVSVWLSDGLCRLVTGGGMATRMLHTDREEMIFEAQRPILLNGIAMLTERPDLAERAITVHLQAIDEAARRPEDELWRDFEAARPRILGALLDAVQSALRNLPTTRIGKFPRMADFLKWATAAESGLGLDPGTFAGAYRENRREVADETFEADPVAVAIRDLVTGEPERSWEGTPSALLAELGGKVSEPQRKLKSWPQTPQALGERLKRVAPLLRSKGIEVKRWKSETRTVRIVCK